MQSFGLQMLPQEVNIIMNIGGNDIFLYDTSIKMKNENITYISEKKYCFYQKCNFTIASIIKLLVYEIKERLL